MIILDGKKLAEEILDNLKKEIPAQGGSASGGKNRRLKLAVILVGENPVSQIFINQKKKACERVGIDFKLYQFPKKISSQELKKEIEKITKDNSNSGIIIQLPLPSKFIPEDYNPPTALPSFAWAPFLNLIPEEKDIDVLSEKSLGKFYQGTLKILPPTVQGILEIFKNYKISLKGKNIVIVGAGRLVGFPLALQLLKEKATVSVLNEFSKDTPSFTKKADILISAVGKPNLIKGDMVKNGAIIIDAGTSTKEGKLLGDVDFKSVSKKASYITPVPGGVGPMTVACLLQNLVKLNL